MFVASCVFLSLQLLLVLVPQTQGHVVLEEPPARNAMWRKGYNLPKHVDDDYLVCTETRRQPCPPCGDRADVPEPRPHEAGGEWATGIITRTYTMGQKIMVQVNVTKSHGGNLEFNLCPHNNIRQPVTQSCLDQYPLDIVGKRGNKVKLQSSNYGQEIVDVEVKLPVGITCDQCVFQMTNNAKELKGRTMFRNCADIAIQGTAKTSMAGGDPLDQPTLELDLHTRSGFGPVFEDQRQYRFYSN